MTGICRPTQTACSSEVHPKYLLVYMYSGNLEVTTFKATKTKTEDIVGNSSLLIVPANLAKLDKKAKSVGFLAYYMTASRCPIGIVNNYGKGKRRKDHVGGKESSIYLVSWILSLG